MKRDIPSNSKDSVKEPKPTKRQPTLDCFIKVQRQIKQQHSAQNQPIKLQAPNHQAQQSGDKSNSNPNANSYSNPNRALNHQFFDPNDPTPYKLSPLSPQQQAQLASTYLNVHFTYACQQCHNDITNYTKIRMDGKILCVKCAGDIVDKNYTVIKALCDESLKEFPQQKKDYDEPVWSFQDQLRLIQALELYGIDSYELIKDHIKTQHEIEDIKAHLEYFINKFVPDLREQSRQARNLFTVEVDHEDQEKSQKPDEKPHKIILLKKKESMSMSSEKANKKQKSVSKASIMQKFNERVRNLLTIYDWNHKTDQLQYEEEPTLFTLLASQVTQEDIRQRPYLIEIINQRRKYEIIEKEITDKALKAIIMSQNEETVLQNQVQCDSESQSLTDLQTNSSKKQDIQNRFLTQEQKWTLFKCQTIKKYNILLPDQSKTLQRYVRRSRLMYELEKIQRRGDLEMIRIRNKYCRENEVEKISVDEFAAGLDEEVVRRVFNMDEVERICKELDVLDWEAQKESKIKQVMGN